MPHAGATVQHPLTLLRLRDEGQCRPGRFAHAIRYGVAPAQYYDQQQQHESQQNWSLSTRQRIHPPVSDSYRRSSRPWTTAMDLSADGGRFLLTGTSNGTVCVYDFGDQDYDYQVRRQPTNNNNNNNQPHRPLQQAETTAASLSAVQWYHDTGIFLTASTNGTVALWDTTAMAPVLNVQPFQYDHYSRLPSNTNTAAAAAQPDHRNSCHCLQLSPTSMLAATGSHHSHLVKLVDFQSGTSSHTLTHHRHHNNNNNHASGGVGGVTAVQWWPHHSHVLASCCAGTVHLWDIRQPRQPLIVLDEDNNNRMHPNELLVSTAVRPEGAHWRVASSPRKEKSNHKNVHTTATNLAFAGPHHLITVCGTRRTIQIWDLRYSPSPVLLPHRYVDPHHGKPLDDQQQPQPLAVTGHCHRDRMLWVSRGHALHGYRLYDNTPGGTPDVVLPGHWGRIHVIAASKTHPKLLTASPTDRLMLVWERRQRQLVPHRAWAGTEVTPSRKRRLDQDSW